MIIFASFTILIILLIYFGFKIQNLQKQIMINQNSLKAASRQINDTSAGMVMLAQQLQVFLVERLESSHKRGLINPKSFETLRPMFEKIHNVALNCMDKGMSVEEALNAVLLDSEVTLDHIKEVIKNQPSDIRMAWTKNTLDGFIIACKGLSFPATKTESSKSE